MVSPSRCPLNRRLRGGRSVAAFAAGVVPGGRDDGKSNKTRACAGLVV
jgi:hypothetical protein